MDNINFNRLDGIAKSYVDYKISGLTFSGGSGTSGTRGTSGVSGSSGSSGSSGTSGVNGVSGMATTDFQYRGILNNASGTNVQTLITNAQFGSFTTTSVQGGLPLMWPMRWERGFTYTSILVEVTSAAAGSTFSFGIYNDNGSNFPSSIIYTSPSLNTATTGFKEVVTSGTIAANTKYWFVALTNGGNPTFRSLAIGYNLSGMTASTNTPFGTANCAYRTFGGGSLTTFTPSSLRFSSPLPELVGFTSAPII